MRKLHFHQQILILVAPGQNSACSEHQPFVPDLCPAINKLYLDTNLTGNSKVQGVLQSGSSQRVSLKMDKGADLGFLAAG